MKEETKRLLILTGIILVALIIVIISTVTANVKAQKYVEKVDEAFAKKENTLVYLGKEGCSYCSLLDPILEDFQAAYKFDYTYIDTGKAKSKLNTILKKFNLVEDEFGTPYLAVVKDGKIIKEQNGYAEENEIFTFLKNTGFIPKEARLAFNYLDYNAYKEKLENKDKTIFVIMQTGCSHCEEAKPVLKELVKEYKINLNVINITSFSETDQSSFMNSLPYYNEEQWGTPLILIVEDKKVVDAEQGFSSKDSYIEFFKKNGYIK